MQCHASCPARRRSSHQTFVQRGHERLSVGKTHAHRLELLQRKAALHPLPAGQRRRLHRRLGQLVVRVVLRLLTAGGGVEAAVARFSAGCARAACRRC